MKSDAASFDARHALLDEGAIVVTPNRRLAATLKRLFNTAQLEAGRVAWQSPDFLPLTTFFERSYLALMLRSAGEKTRQKAPQLLQPAQCQILWEQVIRHSEAADTLALLSIPQTAKQAAAAWSLAHQWKLLAPMHALPQSALHDDGRAFLLWANKYQQLLREKNVIDSAMLPDQLCELLIKRIGDISMPLPTKLVMAGFDIVTPQQQDFFDLLKKLGVAIRTFTDADDINPDVATQTAFRHEFATDDAELRAAATWARACIENSVASEKRINIAIVVPDLRGKRRQIARILTDVLQPTARAEFLESSASQFNISLGQPLTEYALVHDALLLLEFAQRRPIAACHFSALLRSPFIVGVQSENAARAKLDAVLRDIITPEISLFGVQRLLKTTTESRLQRAAATCPALIEVIDRVAQITELPLKATPADWRQHFSNVLAAFGFPGDIALESNGFQILAKFRESLTQLATLQNVQPRMRADEALMHLRRVVAETVFQPEADSNAPIQVLGILESAGQSAGAFDALWVTGLTDDAWPLAARPNPLIPVFLQQRAGVPEASAAASYALDAVITAGWRKCAPTVVFSHARLEGNSASEQVRAASALITDIPLTPAMTGAQNFAEALQLQATVQPREMIPDAEMVSLATDIANPIAVSGGASMIADQAACPFRAFARHRLGAKPLNEPERGLSAAERGTLLHRVLNLVWTQLKDAQTLLAIEHDALHLLIEQSVDMAISEAHAGGQESLSGRFAAIEAARLSHLVRDWLDVERARTPFAVVAAEEARQISISGLSMKLRLDRMDRLADGTHALIDYKTGVAQVNSWLGERLDEPQLPLYYRTVESVAEIVSALAFARLKRGKTFGFEGVSAAENVLPNVAPIEQKRGMEALGYVSWDVLVQTWERSLEQLAKQFADGVATIDPKYGALTCARCDLQSVCRVAEMTANAIPQSLTDERDDE